MKNGMEKGPHQLNRTPASIHHGKKHATSELVDNRSTTAIQHQLMQGIDNSPVMTLQRQQLEHSFGHPIQRVAEEDEELLQGKFKAVQRQEDIEEEELLQGKFETTQRQGPEEEELLQGKFEPVQRKTLEDDEELLQGKFSTDVNPLQLQEENKQPDNRTGIPDQLKAGIESLSGMDMTDVRVHYNSSKPSQLNALAYAQGKDIHLGSGQERHLPHEAWHVVQQRQGRVKPTMQMKGAVNINDDEGLEKEADMMGARALQMSCPDPTTVEVEPRVVTTAQRAGKTSEAPDIQVETMGASREKVRLHYPSTIQRNVGLEIEVGSKWAGFRRSKEMITGEHITLVKRPGFRLENELSGKLEFVIDNPGAETVAELEKITTGMTKLAVELIEYKTKKNKLIPMKKIKGGTKGYYIQQGVSFNGEFQATVGVHLSAMRTLFENAADIGAIVQDAPAVTDQVDTAMEKTVGRFAGTSYRQISPEMEGLLTMVLYYLHIGAVSPNSPFPKGKTEIMAQTDFGQMFKMTPEASYFARQPEKWTDFVCSAAKLDPDGRIFQQKFDTRTVPMHELYKAPHAKTVDITRREWLSKMTEDVDILTQHGGGPEILKSMGSLKKKTDDLGVDGEKNRAVIVELRSMLTTYTVDKWVEYATKIGKFVDNLNARNEDRRGALDKVAQSGSEANLYNTGFEQEAGDEVNAMAYEAFFTEFKSQVNGLAKRARARAELAADEREMTWGKRKGLPTAEELGIKTGE